MSFFPIDDSDEAPESPPTIENPLVERDERVGLLPGEFGAPVSIPGSQFVFDDLSIAFDQYLAFAPGFFITMRVLRRAPRVDDHDRVFTDSLFAPPDQIRQDQRFLWGLRFSDGRKGYGRPLEGSDADFDIVGQGGGGTGVVAIYRFWVHASPGPEMTIYVAWPARGIAETSITIDTSQLATACQTGSEIPGW